MWGRTCDLADLDAVTEAVRAAAEDMGGVDTIVNNAHVLGGGAEGLGNGVEVGQIARATPNLGLRIGGEQLLNSLVGGLLAGTEHGHNRAFLDKTSGDGVADTASAAGDDCFLAFEQHGHSFRTWGAHVLSRPSFQP